MIPKKANVPILGNKIKNSFNDIILLIKAKCINLIDKFFSDIKIENYLQNANCNKNPQNILNKLSNLSKIINENNNVDDDILSQIFEMLINKNNNLLFIIF